MKPINLIFDIKRDMHDYVELMQGYSYSFECEFYDDGIEFDLNGYNMSVDMLLANGDYDFRVGSEVVSGNKVTFNTNVISDYTGDANLQILLEKSGAYTGSWLVNCKVKPSVLNEVKNTYFFTDLKQTIQEGKDLYDKGGVATKQDIAEVYTQLSLIVTREEFEQLKSNVENGRYTGTFYGVTFNGSNPVGTRIGDSVGLVANVGVDEGEAFNHFDRIYPWSHIRRCNLNEAGSVVAYEGEPGFKTDGTNGDVMVEIPKFYQYRNQSSDGEIREYRLSKSRLEGYWLNPRFMKPDGTELDKIYIGAYKASGDSSKLYSKAGAYPQVSINRQVARNRTKAKGTGWGIGDYLERNLIEFLFYIEFATLNSQSIMQGQTNFSQKNSVLAETGVNRVVFTNADVVQYVVGQTVWINNSNRKVLSIETVDSSNKAIVVDGAPFNTTVGMGVDCRGWTCGSADGVKASSGSFVSNTDGKHPFHYRGIENPWGDIWEWVDGICIKDFQSYVAINPTDYADDKFDDPYEKAGFINNENEGYVKHMGFDYQRPYLALPVTLGAGSSTYYSDYYHRQTGNIAPIVGGGWTHGGFAGVSCWSCDYAWSDSYTPLGARLSYKPL